MRTRMGIIASLLWVITWLCLIYSNWAKVSVMPFNEWGDFFAGVFAPIAFLWLVIGYFQQSQELALNTKALVNQEEALRLQVEELKQSVAQQKEMVAITQAELEMTRDANTKKYAERKLLAQPIIELTKRGENRNNNLLRQHLTFSNTGHLIKEVKLLLIDEPTDLVISVSSFDSWGSGDNKRITFSMQSIRQTVDHFQLRIEFIDGLAEHSELTIHFMISDKGSGISIVESV